MNLSFISETLFIVLGFSLSVQLRFLLHLSAWLLGGKDMKRSGSWPPPLRSLQSTGHKRQLGGSDNCVVCTEGHIVSHVDLCEGAASYLGVSVSIEEDVRDWFWN